jgi:hypothetical protein
MLTNANHLTHDTQKGDDDRDKDMLDVPVGVINESSLEVCFARHTRTHNAHMPRVLTAPPLSRQTDYLAITTSHKYIIYDT